MGAAAAAAEDTDTAARIAFEAQRDALAYEMIVEDNTLALSEAKDRATKQLQDDATTAKSSPATPAPVPAASTPFPASTPEPSPAS